MAKQTKSNCTVVDPSIRGDHHLYAFPHFIVSICNEVYASITYILRMVSPLNKLDEKFCECVIKRMTHMPILNFVLVLVEAAYSMGSVYVLCTYTNRARLTKSSPIRYFHCAVCSVVIRSVLEQVTRSNTALKGTSAANMDCSNIGSSLSGKELKVAIANVSDHFTILLTALV